VSSIDKEKYLIASEKGAKWILQHLQKDGSFGPDTKEFRFYYKTAWALIDTGYLSEASKVLDFLKKTHLMDNGDFKQEIGQQEDDPIWHAYSNTWAIIGAQKIGRFDISYKGIDYIRSLQDPESGGVFSKDPGEGKENEEHVIISSACGLACLYTGKLDEARKLGDFLLKMIEMQPEKDKFYSVLRQKNGLVTEFPSEDSVIYVVDSKKTRQWFFSIGHPIGFLAKLYLVTNSEKYLDGAEEYSNFADSCSKQPEGVFSWPASGKIGWGFSVLYNITGKTKYRKMAEKVADYLVNTQKPQGYWTGYASKIDEQPFFATVDVTAEFIVWLREIVQEIEARN